MQFRLSSFRNTDGTTYFLTKSGFRGGLLSEKSGAPAYLGDASWGSGGLHAEEEPSKPSLAHADPKRGFLVLFSYGIFCPTLPVRQRQQATCMICSKERGCVYKDKAQDIRLNRTLLASCCHLLPLSLWSRKGSWEVSWMAQYKASRGYLRTQLPKRQHRMQSLLFSPVPLLSDNLYLSHQVSHSQHSGH